MFPTGEQWARGPPIIGLPIRGLEATPHGMALCWAATGQVIHVLSPGRRGRGPPGSGTGECPPTKHKMYP